MEATHVRDWMTMTPFTVTPDTMLVDAYQLMKSYDIRRLPVLDDDRLVGIVTLGDIRSVVANGALDMLAVNEVLAHTPIKRVMTRNPITVRPEDSVAQAARLMLEYKIGGLPVVKNGELIGIISESDLFRLVMTEPELGMAVA